MNNRSRNNPKPPIASPEKTGSWILTCSQKGLQSCASWLVRSCTQWSAPVSWAQNRIFGTHPPRSHPVGIGRLSSWVWKYVKCAILHKKVNLITQLPTKSILKGQKLPEFKACRENLHFNNSKRVFPDVCKIFGPIGGQKLGNAHNSKEAKSGVS